MSSTNKPFVFDGSYNKPTEQSNTAPKRGGLVSFFSEEPVDVRDRPMCGEWSVGAAPAEDLSEGMDDYKRTSEDHSDLKDLISAMPHNRK